MHELAIAEAIIALVEDATPGQHVVTVTVEIGALSGVSREALQFALPFAAEGTAGEKAVFDLIEVGGRAACQECGTDFPVKSLYGLCACGSPRLTIIAGQDLVVRSIEVEEVVEHV